MSIINNESVRELIQAVNHREQEIMTEMALFGSSCVPLDTSFEEGFALMVKANYVLSKENENLKQELEKQKWIPCSEKLPDKHDFYTTTIEFKDGKRKVEDYVPFIIPEGNWNKPGFWDIGTSHSKVIAWMPCLEVYKENVDQ